MDGVDIYGPPLKETQRAPTLSFTVEGKRPEDICKQLAEKSICAWDGHFYAIRAMEVMDLTGQGGVTRMGMAAYNTSDEVEYVIDQLNKILA